MARNETDLQISCARYLDCLGVLWCHVANERQTSPMRGGKLKKMGVKPGVPDILIFDSRAGFHGLAIELKHGRGRNTESQMQFQLDLQNRGWAVHVVNNIDDFIRIVDDYLNSDL